MFILSDKLPERSVIDRDKKNLQFFLDFSGYDNKVKCLKSDGKFSLRDVRCDVLYVLYPIFKKQEILGNSSIEDINSLNRIE